MNRLPFEILKLILYDCSHLDKINFAKTCKRFYHNFSHLWVCCECKTFQKVRKGIIKILPIHYQNVPKKFSFQIKGSDLGYKNFNPNNSVFICNSCIFKYYANGKYCCNCKIYTNKCFKVIEDRTILQAIYLDNIKYAHGLYEKGSSFGTVAKYLFSPKKYTHDHLDLHSFVCFNCVQKLEENKSAKKILLPNESENWICNLCHQMLDTNDTINIINYRHEMEQFRKSELSYSNTDCFHNYKRLLSKYLDIYFCRFHQNKFYFVNRIKPNYWKHVDRFCDNCLNVALNKNIIWEDQKKMNNIL